MDKKNFLYQIKNSEINICEFSENDLKLLLDFYDDLADLIECLNTNFGFLIFTCLALMFLTDTFNIFLTLKMMGSKQQSIEESICLAYWVITSKIALVYMPFEGGRCIKEVSSRFLGQ